MKKFILSCFGVVSAGSLFAQDASSNNFDLTAAGTAATTISTQLKNLLTGDVLNALLVVMGALVVLWVIRKIPGWIGAGRA